MALYHDATVDPTKPELVTRWASRQPWLDHSDGPAEMIGAFRFDDPEGQVGMETHVFRWGSVIVQAPMTYRSAPLEGAEHALIGETEHSALGTRWVYDGLGDPRYLIMLAAVSLTGQGEALGMVVYGGEWFIAPTNVRLDGGGWTRERVSVDGFVEVSDGGASTVSFANDRFDLVVHRQLVPSDAPGLGLRASWDGQGQPVLLTEMTERS